MEDQHVYHHNDANQEPTINTSVEKNTKGYNYSATVVGARSVEEAMKLQTEIIDSLARVYGPQAA